GRMRMRALHMLQREAASEFAFVPAARKQSFCGARELLAAELEAVIFLRVRHGSAQRRQGPAQRDRAAARIARVVPAQEAVRTHDADGVTTIAAGYVQLGPPALPVSRNLRRSALKMH